MTESLKAGEPDFDPSFFSPEELEMMREADGVSRDPAAEQNGEHLQAQFTAVARLVAEGAERERQLRGLINELTLLAKTSAAQQHSIYTQTQALAQIVIAMGEREGDLQTNLESLRTVILGRAKSVT